LFSFFFFGWNHAPAGGRGRFNGPSDFRENSPGAPERGWGPGPRRPRRATAGQKGRPGRRHLPAPGAKSFFLLVAAGGRGGKEDSPPWVPAPTDPPVSEKNQGAGGPRPGAVISPKEFCRRRLGAFFSAAGAGGRGGRVTRKGRFTPPGQWVTRTALGLAVEGGVWGGGDCVPGNPGVCRPQV